MVYTGRGLPSVLPTIIFGGDIFRFGGEGGGFIGASDGE